MTTTTTRAVTTIVNGVRVTVAPMRAPRRTERTWSAASKYSIFNIGARASRSGSRGVVATPDSAI